MAQRHTNRWTVASTAAPAVLLPNVFGDTNVSVGVVGLVVAILLLMVVLLAVIVIEVTGEHRTNVHDRHEHRA